MDWATQPLVMPIATPAQYAAMLDAAQKGGYAYPAINVTSLTTINGALKAFSEAKSDGIIQVSTGGGEFASGTAVKDAAFGAIILAEACHLLAEKHDVLIALHTDHCHPEKVESFLKPLLQASRERIAAGKGPLFQSHMFDGSVVDLKENLRISIELLKECAELGIILEVEEVYEALHGIGRFMFAATFGNVHGSYKPGAVKLKPSILRDGQAAVIAKYGQAAEMDLVFHGGSGTSSEDLQETLDYGVVKMNIDTDTQYAFTRPIVTHICQNIEGVLKIDGEVGNKKHYDPRSYLKKGEQGLCDRMKQACDELRSTGKTIYKK